MRRGRCVQRGKRRGGLMRGKPRGEVLIQTGCTGGRIEKILEKGGGWWEKGIALGYGRVKRSAQVDQGGRVTTEKNVKKEKKKTHGIGSHLKPGEKRDESGKE